uniref:non-specific serine/threonine protein kinase n=1 Tax=Syphacia muris TaxID=451379 RepID=A0A0N5AAX8_9BILA
MLPIHRPATASTSNPMQLPPSSSSSILHSSDPSPRMRKDAQEVKFGVGRHRDKLEKIRDSLRPYEQPCATEKEAKKDSKYSDDNKSLGENLINNRQMMVNALTQIYGYNEELALLALERVNYSSVIAAAECLDNLGKESKRNALHLAQNGPLMRYSPPLSLNPTVDNSISGNSTLYVPSKSSSSGISVDANVTSLGFSQVSSSLCTVDDSSSSRSESPHARVVSPVSFNTHSSSPPKAVNFQQNNDYYRGHGSQNVFQMPNSFDQLSAFPCTSRMQLPHHYNCVPVTFNGKLERTYAINSTVSPSVMEKSSGHGINCERIVMPKAFYQENSVSGLIDTHSYYENHIEVPHNLRYQMNTNQMMCDNTRRNLRHYNNVEELCEPYSLYSSHGTVMETQTQSVYLNHDLPSQDNTNLAEFQKRISRRNGFNVHDSLAHYEKIPFGNHSIPLTTSTIFSTADVSSKNTESTIIVTSEGVRRCVSPLPESISKKLHKNTFESEIKPCRPRLFCFFMEQHVERLIQQYKERQQRAHQLVKEMESANLPKVLREQLMKILTQKESRYLRLRRQKMNKDMFEIVKHIGFGAFGVVSLVRKKDTGQVYAMKTLNKKDVIKKNQAAHVKAERDILALADSRWIVKLYFSFQDSQCLYFVMEYVPGGDMMQLLILKGFFEEKLARFYIAELTCAIEYVHSLGFIHRDIKPDNILIDEEGHLKLTDFGLCTGLRWTHDKKYYDIDSEEVEKAEQDLRENTKSKVLVMRNHAKKHNSDSLVGTDNYMAPEVIRKTGHTQLCDWWSVGVILYEMVIGRPPFMSHDRESTQAKIKRWDRYLDLDNAMAQKLSRDCVDFMKKLICEQEDRLGRKSGAKEVKAHSWFKGINFATIGSSRAEYIPCVKHAEDTSNFDTFDMELGKSFDTLGVKNGNKTLDSSSPAFYEFTFRHFFDFDKKGCPSLRQRPSLAPLIET